MPAEPSVSKIRWHKSSRQLELGFSDGSHFSFSAEFLRVHSPSAELRGHGNQPPKLVVDKEDVTITAIRPVGHYAMQLVFSDGHDSGIYSWSWLQELGQNQTELWQQYCARRHRHQAEQAARDALIIPIKQSFSDD